MDTYLSTIVVTEYNIDKNDVTLLSVTNNLCQIVGGEGHTKAIEAYRNTISKYIDSSSIRWMKDKELVITEHPIHLCYVSEDNTYLELHCMLTKI